MHQMEHARLAGRGAAAAAFAAAAFFVIGLALSSPGALAACGVAMLAALWLVVLSSRARRAAAVAAAMAPASTEPAPNAVLAAEAALPPVSGIRQRATRANPFMEPLPAGAIAVFPTSSADAMDDDDVDTLRVRRVGS